MERRKRKRYNWKARQQPPSSSSTGAEKLAAARDEGECEGGHVSSVMTAATSGGVSSMTKRRKLSSKQRKKLQKIVETKKRKEKRLAIIDSLQSMAVSSSEMSLLQPSTSLTRNRLTGKEITERVQKRLPVIIDGYNGGAGDEGQSVVVGTSTWKRRKSKKSLAIKMALDPHQDEREGSMESSTSDDCTDDEMSAPMEPSEPAHVQLATPTVCSSLTPPALYDLPASPTAPPSLILTPPSATPTSVPAVYIPVNRTPLIQSLRMSLPILSEEHSVLEAINENPVVIICGETGCGKTTQVPQFLYEAGYAGCRSDGSSGIIGITEPRRVAAISMATRVAHEMNLSSREVSYQIRYEGTTSSDTRIKFMTDGVLLKEIGKDFLLNNYSAIIIDEAHERSVFTDILIGLLSRIVPQRQKNGRSLKLVIMSATLRVSDFTENSLLFPTPPPIVKVESRQFPVTVHFNRHTPDNYLITAYQKVCKIHSSLPSGHILVFLTGKQEIHQLCRKLKAKFSCGSKVTGELSSCKEQCQRRGQERNIFDQGNDERMYQKKKEQGNEGAINLDDYPIVPQLTMRADDDIADSGGDNEESDNEGEELIYGTAHPLLVLPLYSTLSADQQIRVFQCPPDGVRLCVVATNVAETSITIPHVKYVVDSGKVKRKYYDTVTGVSTFKVTWISKASANQRAGRAGRTEPGHCYRLYSSSLFQHKFSEFSEPEICQRPIDDLVLQMKAMNIVKVVNFPFPTSPSNEALMAAEDLLVRLGALDSKALTITPLGRTMASLPVSPSFAKMLSLAHQNGCLPYMVVIASALSVQELFSSHNEATPTVNLAATPTVNLASLRKAWSGQGEWHLLGDLMVLLRAVGAYELSNDKEQFCRKFGIRFNAMSEIRKLRQQLTNMINASFDGRDLFIDPKMAPPTQDQARLLRQLVLTGSCNHVARKININSMSVDDKKKYRFAYECTLTDAPVYLQTNSSLVSSLPQYVVFQQLHQSEKLYMREVTAVEGEWLPRLLPSLCVFSDPLDEPPPTFNQLTGEVECHMTSSFGTWPLPAYSFTFPLSLEKYKWFGVFLLKGEVIRDLKEYTGSLLSPPVTMIKSWAKLHNRTQLLLSALVERDVSNRQQLISVWREHDPIYLLAEYSSWLPTRCHQTLSEIWPPFK